MAAYRPPVKQEFLRDNERDMQAAKAKNARSQFFNSGKAVGSLLNPAKAAREDLARIGVNTSIDHSKRHREAIKKLEAERISAQLADEEAKAAEPFKMERFRDAESRLYQPNPVKAALTPELKTGFMTKGSGGPAKKEALPDPESWERLPQASKPRVPLASELAPRAPLEDIDFVAKNTSAAIRSEPKRAQPKARETKHKDFARVPEYLESRKAELAEAQRQKEASLRRDQPEGMVLMADEERLRTLDVLKANHDALMTELGHFSIVCTTLTRKRRKDEIEAKLKEVESAIELFSKDKVWVSG